MFGATGTCQIALLALLVLGPTPQEGQMQRDPKARLARAELIEKRERDPKTAAGLYRPVLSAPAIAPELAARARAGLARCLFLTGRRVEAEALLAKIAKPTPAGEALQGVPGTQDEARLRVRVHELIDALGAMDQSASTKARSDLVWIGEAVVPYLIERIETAKLDLNFVVVGVATLLDLGGPRVEAYLAKVAKSDDLLLRRAVVRGFSTRTESTGALLTAMFRFTEDKDARVREEALRKIGQRLPIGRILELAADPNAGVRARALRSVGSHLGDSDYLLPEGAEQTDLFVARLRAAFAGQDLPLRETARRALGNNRVSQVVLSRPSGRDLVLDLLATKDIKLRVGSWGGAYIPAPEIERVLAVATSSMLRSASCVWVTTMARSGPGFSHRRAPQTSPRSQRPSPTSRSPRRSRHGSPNSQG